MRTSYALSLYIGVPNGRMMRALWKKCAVRGCATRSTKKLRFFSRKNALERILGRKNWRSTALRTHKSRPHDVENLILARRGSRRVMLRGLQDVRRTNAQAPCLPRSASSTCHSQNHARSAQLYLISGLSVHNIIGSVAICNGSIRGTAQR